MTDFRSELAWLVEMFENYNDSILNEWTGVPGCAESLKSELERAKAILTMTDWQPIESAPEEGVFLISDGAKVMYASREGDYWDIAGYKWPAPHPTAKLGVSHWMPLPDPPKD